MHLPQAGVAVGRVAVRPGRLVPRHTPARQAGAAPGGHLHVCVCVWAMHHRVVHGLGGLCLVISLTTDRGALACYRVKQAGVRHPSPINYD